MKTKLPKAQFRKPKLSDGKNAIMEAVPFIEIETDKLLRKRHATHGDFSENARVMQGVKRVLRTGDRWLKFLQGLDDANGLVDVQAEAIEMIVVKLGRIVTGNPNEADHWKDIEGYARLARERL